jgi:hypothetical protein
MAASCSAASKAAISSAVKICGSGSLAAGAQIDAIGNGGQLVLGD